MIPEQAASAVESFACPTCGSPAGSPCRTRGGNTAFRYHTARFILVKELAGEPEVVVPGDRGPGRPWQPRATPPAARAQAMDAPARIGYACRMPASPGVQDQLDALRAADCERVFCEDGIARVKDRPERDEALRLAAAISTRSDRPVILAVHELGRLARSSAELMTLVAELDAHGIRLEVLTGPLAGIWDPRGTGSLLFRRVSPRPLDSIATTGGKRPSKVSRPRRPGDDAAAGQGLRRGDDRRRPGHAGAGHGRSRDCRQPGHPRRQERRPHPSLASVYRALADADAGTAARLASR